MRGLGAMSGSRQLQQGLVLVRPLLGFSRSETLQACLLTQTQVRRGDSSTGASNIGVLGAGWPGRNTPNKPSGLFGSKRQVDVPKGVLRLQQPYRVVVAHALYQSCCAALFCAAMCCRCTLTPLIQTRATCATCCACQSSPCCCTSTDQRCGTSAAQLRCCMQRESCWNT